MATALWLAFLFVLRVRHQRRMRAVLGKLEEEEASSPRVRVAQERAEERHSSVDIAEPADAVGSSVEDAPSRARGRS